MDKATRKQLIQAIDGALDLLFVPIRKNDAVIASTEKKLGDLMVKAWDEATQDAVKKAAGVINGGSGAVTVDEVKAITAVLADELGPGLQALTPKEVTELVGAAYILGKHGVSSEIGVKASLQLEDVQAQKVLKNHHLFWIGEHYSDTLGEDVAKTVRQVALESGLGRKEVGRVLAEKLGDQFNKSDNYWRLLGAAAVHRARNLGGVQGLIDGGVKEYEILSVLDERTSTICRAMDGKIFTVADARKQRDAILKAASPEDVKSIAPWHTAREMEGGGYEIRANGSKQWVPINGLSQKDMASRGLALPPYHGFCRTTYVVRSFTNKYPASPEPLPIEFDFTQAASTVSTAAKAYTYVKDGKGLGGSGQKSIYKDGSGQEYLFKPALSKSGKQEDFRAYVQEAASAIQQLAYEGGEFIEVKAITLDGKFGTIQPLIENGGDLKAMQSSLNQLPQAMREQIQAEHVIDWLISNHDAHGGQFIISKSGQVLGIDKEQAFRYFPDDKLDWKYHPNSSYGEQEPIYNTLMKDWVAGKIDLNPNHILPYIQRIEAIPDDEYKKLLQPYAEARFKTSGGKVIQIDVLDFMEAAVDRKNNLRKDFEELYSRALSEKLGQKYKFQFGDTMPAKDFLEAPLAVQSFSKTDLAKMNSKAIKEMAKAKEIKYFQQMTKDEVIECLAFPEKAESISAMVKERTRARAQATRPDGSLTTKPEPKPQPTGTDPFENLDLIGAKEFGYALQKDSIIVEGQHVNVRKLFNGERDEYQISFKLTRDFVHKIDEAIKKKGGKVAKETQLKGGRYDKAGRFVSAKDADKVTVTSRNIQATINGAKVQYFNDKNAKAYQGRMVITVDAYDGKKGAEQLFGVLKELGLEAVKSNPTAQDERLLKLSRMLIQNAPREAARLTEAERTVENLERLLKREGLDPKQVDKWTKEEVWPGYFTHIDKAGLKAMKDAGADHLFAGSRSLDGAVGTLTGKGMMATTERYRNGVFHNGASSGTDIGTGGAEQVFLRLVTKNQLGKGHAYSDSYSGGPYVFKIKADVLARTDWYAFTSDNYGRSEDYDKRKGRVNLVKSLSEYWAENNEVMVRHGVQLDMFEKVLCQSDSHRNKLIKELQSRGISKINGQPIEEFIIAQEMIR